MSTELENLDLGNIKKFSLACMACKARVASVYDGDTITLVFKLQEQYVKWSCRLEGIDTPEMKSKNAEEKASAVKARDFLRGKILDKVVDVVFGDFDKYGRLLAKVSIDDLDINKLMLSEGYAKAYDGGTKEAWDL